MKSEFQAQGIVLASAVFRAYISITKSENRCDIISYAIALKQTAPITAKEKTLVFIASFTVTPQVMIVGYESYPRSGADV